VVGGTMASAEHEPITGVWGQSPQRGPGAEPLVRESGVSPPDPLTIGSAAYENLIGLLFYNGVL